MSDDVRRLPVRFKNPPHADAFLVVDHGPKCGDGYFDHKGPYLVDNSKDEVECKTCGAKLNPIWVLRQLASHETRWHETSKRYADEMKRLSDRSRTKCEHCHKLTRISRA